MVELDMTRGVGAGSTAALDRLRDLHRGGSLRGVPTSLKTKPHAACIGIPMLALAAAASAEIHLSFDSAFRSTGRPFLQADAYREICCAQAPHGRPSSCPVAVSWVRSSSVAVVAGLSGFPAGWSAVCPFEHCGRQHGVWNPHRRLSGNDHHLTKRLLQAKGDSGVLTPKEKRDTWEKIKF